MCIENVSVVLCFLLVHLRGMRYDEHICDRVMFTALSVNIYGFKPKERHMLSKDQIKKMARYSYAKGQDIYAQKKISEFHVEEETPYHRIAARVKGSGRKSYEVALLVEDDADFLAESYCECPAFFTYDGLCKHCVAVLLEYIARDSHQRAIREYVQQLEQKRAVQTQNSRTVQAAAPRGRRTTAGMKELLRKQTLRQTLPILQSATCGKVRLEPILTCSSSDSNIFFQNIHCLTLKAFF